MIAFNCVHCQSMLRVETKRPGQKVKCPRCLKIVLVPETATIGNGAEESIATPMDAASMESPSPSLQETVAGVPPNSGGEIASMLAPASV